MSDTFTASNDFEVKPSPFGSAEVGYPEGPPITIYASHMDALREFFEHERDEKLGRKRWPEDPDIVVYDEDSVGVVRVVNEAVGSAQKYREEQSIHRFRSRLAKAARWWFDQKPAMCGETLMVEGQPVACRGRLGHAGDHGHESDGLFLTWADTEAAE